MPTTVRTSILVIFSFLAAAQSLTNEEREKLDDKFKHYKPSVRPIDPRNHEYFSDHIVFKLDSFLYLKATTPSNGELKLTLQLLIKIFDEDLILNGLEKLIYLPPEYQLWLPNLNFEPRVPYNVSFELEPNNGMIAARYSFHTLLPCTSDAWRHPFQMFHCDLSIVAKEGEKLDLLENNDIRSEYEKAKVEYKIDHLPYLTLCFSFPHKWYSSIVTSILPSLLIFCVTIFAQWKKQRVQIFVVTVSVLSIIILQTAHRSGSTLSLEDLWLCCTLLHVVCVLVIDLALPAHRNRYSTINEDSFNADHFPGAKPVFAKSNLTRSGSEGAQIVVEDRPIQTKVTASFIGKRKKIALVAIVICYLMFVVTYCISVMIILFSYR